MENLWKELNKQIPNYFNNIIDEFMMKVLVLSDIETALVGENYALIISIDRFYVDVDYVNKNLLKNKKRYKCSSFFATKYDKKDRVELLDEIGAREMIINNLMVISRGLPSKWRCVLDGNIDWIEEYRKSEWAFESNLHDFELVKLQQYIQ